MPNPDYAKNDAQARRDPRIWKSGGFMPFRLEALTPVFIASGDAFSPLEYVIRREGAHYYMYLVDTGAWLALSQDRGDVGEALKKGDLPALRRLLNTDENLDPHVLGLARIRISSEVVAQNLHKGILDPDSDKKSEIMCFVRNPFSHTAFVPGSSIKGALSTPLIDALDERRRREGRTTLKDAATRDNASGGKACNDVLESMFGNIREHAMQALKVADIAIGPEGTEIREAREMPLVDTGRQPTLKTPCEALKTAPDLWPYGSLLLDVSRGRPGIALPGERFMDITGLRDLCNNFYRERFEEEWQKFYQKAHFRAVREALAPVRQRVRSLDSSRDILLRLGHYSHIECVTIRNNRPYARKGFGKTRTLADRLLPFGWIILSFCEPVEYERGIESMNSAINAGMRQRQESLARQREKELAALEEQRRHAEELAKAKARADEAQARKKREEAEREVLLAGLSPEERAIRELELPGATEAQGAAIYNKLDSLPDDLRLRAAEVLKIFWLGLGKWEGRELSKKQKQKVEKVRTMLKG